MDQIDFGNWKPATGGAASLDELAKATYDEGIHTSNLNAAGVNLTEELDRVNDQIKQATGTDLFHPYRPFGATPAPYDKTLMGLPDGASLHPSVTMPKWKQAVRDLAVKFPDALPWDTLADEPERKAWERMKAAREASNEVSERRGLIDAKDVPVLGSIPVVKQTLGMAAAFAGNAVRDPGAAWTQLSRSLMAQMTSPADAAANLVGFGLPGAAARSLLKNAAFNGLTNAGVQVPLSAYKQGDYQKAGLPYGWDVWLEEVGGAFGTGFALDAGIRGPSRAVISRFGRDVGPDQMFSRNTERGGLLLDAIEKPDVPAPRREPDISRETIEAAAGGDIKATRQILEATGAIQDPEIRGALHRVEVDERLDDEALKALEEMGVARADGVRMVVGALTHASAPPEMPAPVRPAAEPLQPQDGARISGEIGAALQTLPARVAEAVQDGLEAGVPSIVRAIREAAGGPPERLAEAISNIEPRAWAETQMHSGRASPLEMAATIRQFPDVIDSNVSLETDRMHQARAIARLDDTAFQSVANGAVPPAVAALVADLVPREHQARVISDLERARPGNLDEARAMIGDLTPAPRIEGPPLDGGGMRIDDVQGAAAKAQTEALRLEAGDRYEAAMAPILRRDELESQAETIKGQIAKLEEAEPSEKTAMDIATKRAELHAIETELATVQAELDQSAGGQSLARLAMRALDMRREQDVMRAVSDALALGQRILPEGVQVEVKPDKDMPTKRDATSDQTTGDIELAMGAIDPAAKIGHEAVHTLVTKGMIAPDEVAALAKLSRESGTFANETKYREVYADRPDFARIIEEEAAASYIEARIKGTAEGPANVTIERIKQFLERLRNLLNGYGFKSREDIVNALLSGEMARREARAEWGRNVQSAMRAEDITAAASKDGKLYAFAGERARTADLDALARAKEMDSAGTDREAVWRDTGWFKGVDGKWRFEIDDSKSYLDLTDARNEGLKPGQTWPLDHVFGHKEFFSAYDEAEKMGFQYRDFPQGYDDAGASFIQRTNEVLLNSKYRDFTDDGVMRSFVLHEGQHKFQSMEEFARGGSDRMFTTDQIADERTRLQAISDGRPKSSGWDFVDSSPAVGEMTDKMVAHSLYRRLAGETEARTVQKRMDLTPSERRSRPPWLDYDVPEADQIVRMPEQDKLYAISDRDAGQSMRRDLDALGYYSKALEAAHGLKQATGTPEQMLAQLKSAGVKDAEIEATGLGEFLKGFGSTTALESNAITLAPNEEVPSAIVSSLVKFAATRPSQVRFAAKMKALGLKSMSRDNVDSIPSAGILPLQPARDLDSALVDRMASEGIRAPRNDDDRIWLYKVGDQYFVYDGHHRVAAAQKRGQETISARVFSWGHGDRTASPPRRALLKQVTKSEIVKHLEENRVQVKEVFYQDADAVKRSVIEEGQQLFSLREMLRPSLERRALRQYRPSNVMTSADLPGRFTWKTPPTRGTVQMFHATNRNFDRFDMAKSQDFGIHFGTSGQAWKRIEDTGRENDSRVIPANVSFKNAVVTSDLGYWGPFEVQAMLENKGFEFTVEDARTFKNHAIAIDRADKLGPSAKKALQMAVVAANQSIREKLNDLGIDAIWYRNDHEGKGWSLLVWNEGQVHNTITGDLLYAMRDGEPEPSLKSDMAQVNRIGAVMRDLIEACRS